MDNAKEFRSQQSEIYCVASGISLTYSVPYEHFQSGLAQSFIKMIQFITRLFLIHAKLPSSFWSHAVVHAATLLRFRPTLLNDHSPFELTSDQVPNVSHLRTFGCRVWVPVEEPHGKTIGRHCQEGIYVDFDLPCIIRYVISSVGTLQRARFQNCKFEENHFPSIETPKPSLSLEFWAPKTFTLNPNPRTALADSEVSKFLHLKSLAKKLPDGFSNTTRITRNPLPGVGLSPITVLPQKRSVDSVQPSSKMLQIDPISLHSNLSTLSDTDPVTLNEAKSRPNWPQWLAALNAEYSYWRKHNVFGPLVTNLVTKPIGFKLSFTKKQNAQGQIVRYKVRLVAQRFTQRLGIDHEFTYSHVMDSNTFRYLLGMVVQYFLETQLLDVVTTYLYGPIDVVIHIRPPPDFLLDIPPEDTQGSYLA